MIRRPLTAALRGAVIFVALASVSGCGSWWNPFAIAHRSLEDRTADAITADTEIFADANAAMALRGVTTVSTQVYEQRLLAYGTIESRAVRAGLLRDFQQIPGVKALYWHVAVMSEADWRARREERLGLAATVEAEGWIEALWLEDDEVTSLNLRIGVDEFGTAYLLGRAFDGAEHDKALALVRSSDRVRKVVDYIDIRP